MSPRPSSASSSSSSSISSQGDTNNDFSEETFYEYVEMKGSKFKAFVKKVVKPRGPLATSNEIDSETATNERGSGDNSSAELTESERAMYSSERLDNFRWLSKLVGSYADCPPLTDGDLVEPKVSAEVGEIGQFAEVAYSSMEVETLFSHYAELSKEGILLEYPILGECDFITKVYAKQTELSAFVAFRRTTKQLVVSIAGSSTPKHAIQNLRAIRKEWRPSSCSAAAPIPDQWESIASATNIFQAEGAVPSHLATAFAEAGVKGESQPEKLGVHTGFLTLYEDARVDLEKAIQLGVEAYLPEELVITGHSMGGSVSYLLCMDLLSPRDSGDNLGSGIQLPQKLCLTTFGTPRSGNPALVVHFRKLVKGFKGVFREYSVKAFNDGVPAVPPRKMGYVHFCARPMYAFRRRLYNVPEGQGEFSLFRVQDPECMGANPKMGALNVNSAPGAYSDSEKTSSDRTRIFSRGKKKPNGASSVQLTVPGSADGGNWGRDDRVNSFPRGGHNYYNGRDLEGFKRITDRLEKAQFPSAGWQTRFSDGRKRVSVGPSSK